MTSSISISSVASFRLAWIRRLTRVFVVALLLIAPALPSRAQLVTSTVSKQLAISSTRSSLVSAGSLAGAEQRIAPLDEAARLAQREVIAAVQSGSTKRMTLALDAYGRAEIAVEQELDSAWSAITLPRADMLLLRDPLSLAFHDLHIQLRRVLGPDFHTLVPGLDADRGCAGDVIQDQLVREFGQAVTSGVLSADELPGHPELGAFAAQVACLGGRQLAELDLALPFAVERVVERMESHGDGRLERAFTRAVAPLMVVLFDATKHTGNRSESWRWFDDQAAELQQDVDLSGWATGALLVWNRSTGGLVAMASCASGAPAGDCVDLATFIESLADPRAIGLGDCSLAGMVGRGTESIGGEARYVCPTQACESKEEGSSLGGLTATTIFSRSLTTSSSPLGADGEAIAQRWPQLDDRDASAMAGFCRGEGEDLQGAGGAPSACAVLPEDGGPDPFGAYLGCVAESIGAGSEPQITQTLQGVPMGSECSLTDGGDAPKTADAGGADATDTTDAEAEDTGIIATITTWVTNLVSAAAGSQGGQVSSGGVGAGAGALVSIELQLLDPATAPEAIRGLMTALVGWELKGAYGRGEISLEQLQKGQDALGAGRGSDAVEILANRTRSGGDCPDPAMCSNSCGGLSSQIDAVSACTDALTDSLADALGLGDRDSIDESVRIIVDPAPDAEPEDGSDGLGLGSCFDADLQMGSVSPTCGAMMCADGLVSNGLGDDCGCGETVRVAVSRVCTVRCADGVLPDADCLCTTSGGYVPEPPGFPDPVAAYGALLLEGTALLANDAIDSSGDDLVSRDPILMK